MHTPESLTFSIPPISRDIAAALQRKIDTRTKPPGSLGQLEAAALRLGLILHTCEPVLKHPSMVVFAGDHGIAAQGQVNPFPQAVTAQMVLNFLSGGAAINVFCRQHGIALTVVDAGVKYDFGNCDGLVHAKIAPGTRNYLEEPAMSPEACSAALATGADIVRGVAAGSSNVIGFGEMGIGNTSSAALLSSRNARSDNRLKELHFGDWEMRAWDDLPAGPRDQWLDDFVNHRPPGGESYGELQQRALSFMRDVLQEEHETALVVTHGGVIRALLAHWQERPALQAYDITIGYGSVNLVEYTNGVMHVHWIDQ